MKKENEKHSEIKKWRNEQKKIKIEKRKSKKKDKKTGEKKLEKKEKRAQRGFHKRWAQKLIFHTRTVKRNRNEIEAPKKSDFEHPTKTKKMIENERI